MIPGPADSLLVSRFGLLVISLRTDVDSVQALGLAGRMDQGARVRARHRRAGARPDRGTGPAHLSDLWSARLRPDRRGGPRSRGLCGHPWRGGVRVPPAAPDRRSADRGDATRGEHRKGPQIGRADAATGGRDRVPRPGGTARRAGPRDRLRGAALGAVRVSFTVGTAASPRTFGPLHLAALVRYAGASADFQPLHFDAAFAKSAGFPQPIVHGMLSGGLIGTYLSDWVGVAAVRRIRVRFHQPVPMGAMVVVTGSVVAQAGGTAQPELALTADGTRAVSASATVELDLLRR